MVYIKQKVKTPPPAGLQPKSSPSKQVGVLKEKSPDGHKRRDQTCDYQEIIMGCYGLNVLTHLEGGY